MEKSIAEARQAALARLTPSAKDLEHGLQLHADATVVDVYGFAPRFPADAQVLRRASEAGADERELADLREQMWMVAGAADARQRRLFLQAWEAAGVTCIVQNAGAENAHVPRLLRRLAHFTHLTDVMGRDVARAVTPEDIIATRRNGKRCLYFSANAVPLPLHLNSVEEELSYVGIFFQLGVRMAHLTYNRRNLIGDGCGEKTDAGLSDFGRTVVAEMNRIGMIVDVSHSGVQTSLEAAQVSDRPICASHTVCCAVNDHFRGKPDDVIRAIVEKEGLVGICCVPGFLGGTADVNALLDHVDHVAKTFGADYVAIGTDWGCQLPPGDAGELPPQGPTRSRWEMLWPPELISGDPQCNSEWAHQILTLAWTNWPLFTVGLVQRGYCDDDIRKIVGGNFLRLAASVLPAAPTS